MDAQARRRLGLAAAVAAALLACAAPASGEPVGRAESFPTRCGVGSLALGREGNVWFTCLIETDYGFGSRVKFGRVTPAGRVSEFSGGFDENLEAGEIAVAADGDLWFPLNPFFRLQHGRRPPQVARVTPTGEATVYRPGLDARHEIGDLVAAPSGYLWFSAFGEEGRDPSLWQIAPSGDVSKLPIDLGEKAYPDLEVGPEGDLWFSKGAAGAGTLVRLAPGGAVTEFGSGLPGFSPGTPIFAADGSGWFFQGEHQTGVGRVTGAGAIADIGAKLDTAGGIVGGATIGPDGNLWFGFQSGRLGKSAIERVTPSGEVTEFRDCLRYSQPFFGPATLVTGARGDIWFTSVASRLLPGITDPPSIGRVTPSGEIAQIYAGVNAEASSILAAPDGSIWFSGGVDEIQRIKPLDGPINTFHVAPLRRAAASGAAGARVVVAGPGRIELKPLALLLPHRKRVPLHGGTVTATASGCGATTVPVKPVGPALRLFRERREAVERVAVTFTPVGGTPYTETAKLDFYAPRRHRG